MRVLSRATLLAYLKNRVDGSPRKTLKSHLDAWFAETEKAQWKNSAELKSQFASASIVSARRVVFNIKDNEYRLIVEVDYAYCVVLIKWLGTHKEYDRINVEAIEYDPNRYADPPH